VCDACEADVEGALELVRMVEQHIVLGSAALMATAAFAGNGSAPARTL
jgi:hypothetical protein